MNKESPKDEEWPLVRRDLVIRVGSLESKIDTLLERSLGQRDTIERINKYLFTGNGMPPMTARMQTLEDNHKENKTNGYIAKLSLAGLLIKAFWDSIMHVK